MLNTHILGTVVSGYEVRHQNFCVSNKIVMLWNNFQQDSTNICS